MVCCCGLPWCTGTGGPECSACKPGSFSLGGSTAPCQLCAPGLTSPSGATGPDFCSCPAGQGAPIPILSKLASGSGTCVACPAGSYSSGPPAVAKRHQQRGVNSTAEPIRMAVPTPLPQPCIACPDGKISEAGAKRPEDCCEYFQADGTAA